MEELSCGEAGVGSRGGKQCAVTVCGDSVHRTRTRTRTHTHAHDCTILLPQNIVQFEGGRLLPQRGR
jgi:hypothetical protein